MSTKFVTITGADLAYFTDLVQQAIQGSLGNLTEVVIEVSNSKAQISTNGYTSSEFGTVRTDQAASAEKAWEPMSGEIQSIEESSPTTILEAIESAFPGKTWNLNINNT